VHFDGDPFEEASSVDGRTRAANRSTEFRVEVVGRRNVADQVVELTLGKIDGAAPRSLLAAV
jgi:hypothetical protein